MTKLLKYLQNIEFYFLFVNIWIHFVTFENTPKRSISFKKEYIFIPLRKRKFKILLLNNTVDYT